ncbi:MAG: Fic family protein, partial [Microbacteriaceae bacterium]|nr:Fic family protein [Microbacteriaceae bacterium]
MKQNWLVCIIKEGAVKIAWPKIGHKSGGVWRPDPRESLGRKAFERNSGPYNCTVAPQIATTPAPEIPPRLAKKIDRILQEIRVFDEGSAGWGAPFASILLRSESASSSQIERLTAGTRNIAIAGLIDDGSGTSNAAHVARNTATMRAAIEFADTFTAGALLKMHEILGGGDDPENAGKLRQQVVWIKGDSPVTADHVGVYHDDIPAAIADLIQFMWRQDIDPLTQAAIAHAQFETIHPFTDGNGRTGRALVSTILRGRGCTKNMTVPIASGLLTDVDAYFAALEAARKGDIAPIIIQFCDAAEKALINASYLREDVAKLREAALSIAGRRTENLEKTVEICISEPVFTLKMLVNAGVQRQAAYRIVERLEEAEIIKA